MRNIRAFNDNIRSFNEKVPPTPVKNSIRINALERGYNGRCAGYEDPADFVDVSRVQKAVRLG